MERTEKIITDDKASKFLHAPHLPWGRAIFLGKPIANDNFDDDPPPAASAPIITFPSRRDDKDDCQTPGNYGHAHVPIFRNCRNITPLKQCTNARSGLLSSVSPTRRFWK